MPATADERQPTFRGRLAGAFLLLASALSAVDPIHGGEGGQGGLHHRSLDLPGAPVAVIPTDLDGDGRRDLAVAVVYTTWDQIELEEQTEIDEIEGLVEVLTIVPALLDHRELHLFLAEDDGGYSTAGEPLALAPSVLSLEAGPGDRGLLALTDDGVAALRWPLSNDAETAGAEPFELWVEEPPVLAGTGAFFPPIGLLHDLDGEGGEDLLLPAMEGLSLYLGRGGRFASEATQRGLLPVFDDLPVRDGGSLLRLYPLPEVRDADGDGKADLLFPHPRERWSAFQWARNLGGRFEDLRAPLEDFSPLDDAPAGKDPAEEEPGEEAALFEDLDGDGRAELITQTELEGPTEGMRAYLKEARRPEFRYRVYPQRPDGTLATAPALELQATGYALAGDPDFPFPGGFRDLDGDGRKDLVTLTLDFSLMQAVRVMATQRISIGLDFHVWCQRPDGSGFARVPGLDLSGKFKLNLRNLRLNQLSQFAGDFNGDGRADFLQIGRGKQASIHLGREGCSYPREPDVVLDLSEEPEDLTLVQVRDLDGDGLSDVQVIQPLAAKDAESSAPVRLDLYLSGGGR